MSALELSSNWKKLQATLKKQNTDSNGDTKKTSSASSSLKRKTSSSSLKRKATSISSFPVKRTKMSSPVPATSSSPPTDSITSPIPPHHKNAGLIPSVKAGRYLSLDCEMVATTSSTSALARVSIVNWHLQLVYDGFVVPSSTVIDYRTAVSGVRPEDLRKGYARPMTQVVKEVEELLRGKVLVGHALRNDLGALGIGHLGAATRDTARAGVYRAMVGGRTPSLRELSERVLGVEIQGGEHCSAVDARAAMELYRREKKGMDEEARKRYRPLIGRVGSAVLNGKVAMEDDEEGKEEMDALLDGESGEGEGAVESLADPDKASAAPKQSKKRKKRKHKSKTTRA